MITKEGTNLLYENTITGYLILLLQSEGKQCK